RAFEADLARLLLSPGGDRHSTPHALPWLSSADSLTRVVPSVGWRDLRLGLGRSPGTGLVFVYRCVSLQRGIHDSPCLLHIILAGEKRGVPCHGISQHTFVRVHLIRN